VPSRRGSHCALPPGWKVSSPANVGPRLREQDAERRIAARDRRDERDRRDTKFEDLGSEFRTHQSSTFRPLHQSRFSRQSRPFRLSQASAIAAELFMNNAGENRHDNHRGICGPVSGTMPVNILNNWACKTCHDVLQNKASPAQLRSYG